MKYTEVFDQTSRLVFICKVVKSIGQGLTTWFTPTREPKNTVINNLLETTKRRSNRTDVKQDYRELPKLNGVRKPLVRRVSQISTSKFPRAANNGRQEKNSGRKRRKVSDAISKHKIRTLKPIRVKVGGAKESIDKSRLNRVERVSRT